MPKILVTESSCAELSAETDQPPSGPDERKSLMQMINGSGSVEEVLQDMHISRQTNLLDKQNGDIRQKVMNRVVCAYHPGGVREKVLRAQNFNCNTDPSGSDSRAASCMSRPLGVFHQQNILQSWTPKTVFGNTGRSTARLPFLPLVSGRHQTSEIVPKSIEISLQLDVFDLLSPSIARWGPHYLANQKSFESRWWISSVKRS